MTSFVTASKGAPTVEMGNIGQMWHVEPMSEGWQNEVIRQYYAGRHGAGVPLLYLDDAVS
jgi:hypothetical protein